MRILQVLLLSVVVYAKRTDFNETLIEGLGDEEFPTRLLLVRHGKLGDRVEWAGLAGDSDRSLDVKGVKQAKQLIRFTRDYSPIVKIVSSPFRRATQMIAPLADAVDIIPDVAGVLADEGDLALSKIARYIRALVSAARTSGGGTIVVCGHSNLANALGFDLPFRKGAVWVFEAGDLTYPTHRAIL